MPARAAAAKSRPSTGTTSGEYGLGPAIACSMAARSTTVRAIGPATLKVCHGVALGYFGTRPGLGRKPTTPQNAAGVRRLPPRSEPSASANIPQRRPAAPPPAETLALRALFHGLRVAPNTALTVLAPAANSGVLVLPMTMAPAALRRCTTSASSV